MNNFLDFINKDVEAKKTLVSSLPTKTKTNQKKYNQEISSMIEKYEGYKDVVYKYLVAKSRSFSLKKVDYKTEEIKDKINTLEEIIALLNPINTAYEKLGFGYLIYQLRKSYLFNFSSLNDIINKLLDKFEMAGIGLSAADFDYTCYVNEYMSSFLEVRHSDNQSYKKVSEIFDRIYWVNPELIQHIELNFRKLINTHERSFNAYVERCAEEKSSKYGIKSYQEARDAINSTYSELYNDQKEDIYEIVEGAKSGDFEVNNLLPDNKVRTSAFTSIIDSSVDFNDLEKMNKICATLESLKLNIREYDSYVKFQKVFTNFGDKFKSLLGTKSRGYKGLSNVVDKISSREKELEKINRKINSGNSLFFNDNDRKVLKVKSVNLAKEIYELYSYYDDEYFKSNVLNILNDTISVSDVLNLYESFPYFKMLAIQEAFNTNDYDETLALSEEFNDFALNTSNVIVCGIPIFGESNIPMVIANKYKLHNLKISTEDLSPENTSVLLNKILLILRVNAIENSDLDISKVWFMAKVAKIEREREKNN